MKFSDCLQHVIEKCDERRQESDLIGRGDDGEVLRLEDAHSQLIEREKRPARRALREALEALSDDELVKIWLLAICGKEDGAAFSAALSERKAEFPGREEAVGYLLEKVPLGDYLQRGRQAAIDEGVDLDAEL